MKLFSFLAIAASCAFSVIDALALEKRDGPAVVAFDLAKVSGNRTSGSLRHGLSKRGSDEATINNENFLWTVSLELGTPPQTTRCQLDTGSSDLVTETDSSDLCVSSPTVCSGRGAC
jgi:predicted outer membrane lipoprotein